MPDGHGDIDTAAFLTDEERAQSVVITDPSQPDNPVIFVSDEFELQTGYPPSEVLGRNCRFLQGPETDLNAIAAIRQALKTGSEITIDILNYKKNGTKFWNRLRIRPLLGDDGKLVYFAGAQNPINSDEMRPGKIDSITD